MSDMESEDEDDSYMKPIVCKSPGPDTRSKLDILMSERFLESEEWQEMVISLLKLDDSGLIAVYDIVAASIEKMKYNSRLNDGEGIVLHSSCIKFIEKLLNYRPAAIAYQDDSKRNLLRLIIESGRGLTEYFAFDLIKLIVAINKQQLGRPLDDNDILPYDMSSINGGFFAAAFKLIDRKKTTKNPDMYKREILKLIVDANGALPIHLAAKFGGLSTISFLLDEYPESCSVVDKLGGNLLHYAIYNPSEDSLNYLLGRYPKLLLKSNKDGMLPIHDYIYFGKPNNNMKIISSICNINTEVLKKPTFVTKRILLHLVINAFKFQPVSPSADILRLLLRLYPAAVNVKDKFKQTPYDIAVDRKLDTYFLRLLLREDLSMNPQELYRLNYKERRMALFISAGAAIFGSTNEPIIWRMLWMNDKEILKKVISFL